MQTEQLQNIVMTSFQWNNFKI